MKIPIGRPLFSTDRFYFATCCDISSIDDDVEVISNPVFEAIEAEDEDDDNSIDNEVCGIRSPVPYTVGQDLFRIVGGNSTAFGAWPWQASSGQPKEYFLLSAEGRRTGTTERGNFCRKWLFLPKASFTACRISSRLFPHT